MPRGKHVHESSLRAGRAIHRERLARRITTHELQRRTGFDRRLIRLFENGAFPISLMVLARIAIGLGCRIVDLLGDSGEEEARASRGRETAWVKGNTGGRP